jgi:hypothetical protein
MRRPPNALLLVVTAAVLLLAWFFRPWLHGPAMVLWTAPLVWLPPAALLVAGAVLTWRRRRAFTVEAIVSPRTGTPPVAGFAVAAVALFIVLGLVNGPLTARALFQDTRFEELRQLPAGGNVRLVPKEVAEAVASGGFNSPTEFLSDFAITRTQEGLQWTALRTPEGLVRTFTRKSAGIVTLDALETSRSLEQVDAELETAPGLQVTDNLRWRLLKRHYFIELGEFVGVRAPDGSPRILVPYTEFRGIFIRRPELGGVFVVHPDGRIEDLEPEEARRRPEVAQSGRLFPVDLARRIQDSYAYKRGIWNRFFVHEEQTQISDTEANPQPYLIDFGDRGTKWVTVAEPYGRAFAANAVFLTDTLTGQTQVYRVPRGQSLSGNRRALDAVRALSIPGIVFADAGPQAAGGGRFRVVEPRPVFRDGRLVYLVSIVPQTAQSVSKTVIIDAETNRAIARFDNDTDAQAEEKTLAFLRGEEVPAAGDGAAPAEQDEPRRGETRQQAVRRRLDALIRSQREILRETEALQRELQETAP